MPAAAKLAPSVDPFVKRLRWLMAYGPLGPLRQIDLVRNAESLQLGGLNRAEVNRLMQGQAVDPKLSTLRKLASALSVTLRDLLPEEDSRVRVERGWVRVPRMVWSEQAVLQDTGGIVVVPSDLLPSIGNLVAVGNSHSIAILDVARATPEDGAMMAIRHPETGRLTFMRSYLERGVEWRFVDEAGGFLLGGDASLCVGEVVVQLGRVERLPAAVRESRELATSLQR